MASLRVVIKLMHSRITDPTNERTPISTVFSENKESAIIMEKNRISFT